MNEQFIIPDHPPIPITPYSKEYFEKRKRNLLVEATAMNQAWSAKESLSSDLFSNLVGADEKNRFDSAKWLQKISKDFSFAACHALPYHKGKCRFLHGHEWKLRVEVEAPVNDEGMVMDFSDLKRAVNDSVIEMMDHSFINALLFNPTAENICVFIWNVLQYEANLKHISKITVWETPTSEASIDARTMSDIVRGMWEWK